MITGYRPNAREPAQRALERILGLTPDAARSLARSLPAVVVQGAANDNAERIRAALENAGALVELRASPLRLERAPLDLPRQAEPGVFDFDLDLPMGAGGGSPAKANKGGTGTFAAPGRVGDPFATSAQTSSGPLIAPRAGAGPLAVPAPPGGRPSLPQQTTRSLRGSLPQQPPPPPAAAYKLGDFGVAPRGQSVVARLPTAPPSLVPAAPTLADGDFELESQGHGGLELDLGGVPHRSFAHASSAQAQHEVLGERLAGAGGSAKVPDVDPQLVRSLQRRAEVAATKRASPSLVAYLVDGPWLSLLMVCAVTTLTLGAVGYALDPGDPLGGLAQARGLALGSPSRELARAQGHLHPLLRNTPRALRAPVAAVLRAQISGVLDVPVAYPTSTGQIAQCTLVEHGSETEARLERVRETGHEVAAPPEASAQLIEHERALRAERKRPDLQFTRVCLVP